MFGNNIPTSGLTFSKVLSGISKTLNVANQVIPLYQQAKPMINNAKTIMSILKGLTNKSSSIKSANSEKQVITKTQNISQSEKILPTPNTPIFFQ